MTTTKNNSKEEVKVKRVSGGLYRVYKKIGNDWKIKRTFFTAHQANRYIKGFARNKR